jgi:putative transposase
MNIFRLQRGLRCRDQDGRVWTLDRQILRKRLQFIDENGEITNLSHHEFRNRWATLAWSVDLDSIRDRSNDVFLALPPDLSAFSLKDQLQASIRHAIIAPLTESTHISNHTIAEHCRRLAKSNGTAPSVRTVRRWLAKYLIAKNVTALINRRRRPRTGNSGNLDALICEAIDHVFLSTERRSRSAVHQEVCASIHRFNAKAAVSQHLTEPSRATIYRRLQDLEGYASDRRRFGTEVAAHRHRTALPYRKPDRNLERIELDHCLLDLLLADDKTGMALGRPWLTIAIDCNSRMVVGFHLSFDPPSANTVLQCLRVSVLPKTTLLAKYPDITTPWPTHGIWFNLVMDNGMEMHSERLKRAALELGTHIQFCPTRRPWFKGHIERLNRTLNDGLIHSLPGTTFSSPADRAGYPSSERSCLGFRAFEHILTKWIVEEYHLRPHRSLKCSPLERWNACEDPSTVALPASPAELELLAADHKRRPVFHYGVELDRLRYNSPALQDLVRRERPYRSGRAERLQLEVRYHEHTVEYVEVLDPSVKEYIRVPATDPEYSRGLDRYTHRVVQMHLKAKYGRNWGQADRRRIREFIDQLVVESKDGTRKARRLAKRQAELRARQPNRAVSSELPRTAVGLPDFVLTSRGKSELPALNPAPHRTDRTGVARGRL